MSTAVNDNGYGASVAALDYRTRGSTAAAGEPGREGIVRDGEVVRVPMSLMDQALADDLASRYPGGAR